MNNGEFLHYDKNTKEVVSLTREEATQKNLMLSYTERHLYGTDRYVHIESDNETTILELIGRVILRNGSICPQERAVFIERDDCFYHLDDLRSYICRGGNLDNEYIYIPNRTTQAYRYVPDDYFLHDGDAYSMDDYTTCSGCDSLIDVHNDYTDENGYCEGCSIDNDDEWEEFYFVYHEDAKIEMPYNRLFGVELETETKRRVNAGDFIKSEDDGSINGYEHVTRKLMGEVDLANLKRFCEEATKDGIEVDGKCGYHLHLDASDFSLKHFNSLLALYSKFETVFYRMLPASRLLGNWCKPLAYRPLGKSQTMDNLESKFYKTKDKEVRKRAKSQKSSDHRYMGLNLHSYFYRQQEFGRGSVELRYHSGTMDSAKVINWIYIHQFMFDLAFNLTTKKVDEICKNKTSKELLLKELIRKKSKYSDNLKESLCAYIDKRMDKFKTEHTLHKYSKEKWFYLDESQCVEKITHTDTVNDWYANFAVTPEFLRNTLHAEYRRDLNLTVVATAELREG